jgi:(E)-4-hydroxy-3-methylbut-2-enyl-diphosphate synthase
MTSRSAPPLLVVDTDVLIDYLRDQPQAVAFLEGTEQPLAASVITVAELYAGMRDGEEGKRLDAFVAAFEVLPLDRQPAQRAGLWRRQYGPSHGTRPGGCADRRQRRSGRRHPGDPEPAPLPDAGGGVGALRHFSARCDRLWPRAAPAMTAAPSRSDAASAAAGTTAPAAGAAAEPLPAWANDPRYATTIRRRKTRSVRVGDIWIGSDHPVVVQSMINEDTLDIEGATAGIRRLHEAGCEIVRVTVPSLAHAKAMGEIRKRLEDTYRPVPLVADVHHNGMKIALEVAQHVDKVRINPGLFVFDKPDPNRSEFTPEEFAAIGERIATTFEPLVSLLKAQDKALRIGVNHGSLAERMLFTYGDTPLGMVQSALEFIRICDRLDFHNIVVSMKASRAPVVLASYRMMADRMDAEGFPYPLHLGVTEAGDGDYGRIKSTAGIATLLSEGLGDTIRVSLTEAPEKEIPVCYSILQALGLRKTMVEYVACPSCGRTLFNLEEVLHQVRSATAHLTGLDIAVMGCIVNGPGEMADADYGYVGKTPGTISLYRGRDEIRRVPEAEGVEALIALIREDGRWVDP